MSSLAETFWTGPKGWAEKQFADGTVEFRSPSGRVYTTTPGGALYFPVLATPTGKLTIDKLTAEPSDGRGVMMPRRKHTRKEERTARISAERAINEQRLKRQRWLFDELEMRRAARAANEPPPF